jgi:hypothetical protein
MAGGLQRPGENGYASRPALPEWRLRVASLWPSASRGRLSPLAVLLESVSGYLLGILAAVAAGAILAFGTFLIKSARRRRGQAGATINLPLSARLAADERLRFGLLHVRDGRGAEAGPLKNEIRWFERAPPDGDAEVGSTLTAALRYRRELGAQFKCFVDHPGLSFEQISELLASETQLASPTDAGDRTWFFLRSYPSVDAGGGLQNNFRFPV